MGDKIVKVVLFALLAAVFASAALPPLPALAVPGDAKNMTVGCWADARRWIFFGGVNGEPCLWRVLEVYLQKNGGAKTAILLAENAVDERRFDADDNDWNSSEIAIPSNGMYFVQCNDNAL